MHKVALLVSSMAEGSETFVKRHIEQLGSDTLVVFGGTTPYKTHAFDESQSTAVKLQHSISRLLGNKDPFASFLLKRLLTRHGITQVYAEFGPVGVGCLPACKALGIQLVVNFHGYDAFRHDTLAQYREPYKVLFAYAHKVIGVSQSMCQQLKALGCPIEKIVYSPCYPDPKFAKLQYQPKTKQLTFIGRFVEKKAPWLTLMCFHRIVQQYPDATLVMAGDGPLLSVCKSLAATLSIPNVEFPGMLSHDQVEQLLADTMVYVQHSIVASDGDREGTPVSVMEAMSAGIPVVSTQHEGINDVFPAQCRAFLVPEHDVDAMVNACVSLLSDAELRHDCSNRLRQHAQQLLAAQPNIGAVFSEQQA